MRLVILESPYAGEVERNVEYGLRCLRDSLQRDEAPIASHLLYTRVLDDAVPEQRELGIAAGLEWVEKADAMVVYEDLGISPGMQFAIKWATVCCLPIEFRLLETLDAVR